MFADRRVARVTLVAAAASGVAVPLLVTVVRAAMGTAQPVEVFVGSAVGTLFFAVTGLVSAVYGAGPGLRRALLYSYVFKIAVLLGFALLLPTRRVDGGAFASGLVASAATYVVVQALLLGRRTSERTDDAVD